MAVKSRVITFFAYLMFTYDFICAVPTGKLTPDVTLASFLRNGLSLTATKLSCFGEGGCGACVVILNGKSVNACLIPVVDCQGSNVTTLEGLDKSNPIPERLSEKHGTQCGFCTPGMVMTMHGYLINACKKDVKDIENLLDGNLCRCTGYRPILDAFKSLTDTKIENGVNGSGNGIHSDLQLKNSKWSSPKSLKDLKRSSDNFICGNTMNAVYKDPDFGEFDFVDLKRIEELKKIEIDDDFISFGGTVTLNEAIQVFKNEKYPEELIWHWSKIGSVAVRNVASIAGNLMMKRCCPDFQSDVFVTLLALEVTLKIYDLRTMTVNDLLLRDFMTFDMDHKLIKEIQVPKLKNLEVFKSYKVSQRSQNSHATISAAFKFRVRDLKASKANITFAGLDFDRAEKTEAFFNDGRDLRDQNVLKVALDTLALDLDQIDEFRFILCQSLLYKAILSILGYSASASVRSGSSILRRQLSKGQQVYETNPEAFPFNEPVRKLESHPQCRGEAEFVADIPPFPGQLYGALVLASQGNCRIKGHPDASKAMALDGVVAFVDHHDIFGENDAANNPKMPEEVFSSGKIYYAGQSVGIVVAETPELAAKAASLIKIEYENVQKPVLTIQEALKIGNREDKDREKPIYRDSNSDIGNVRIIEGEFEMTGNQAHFHLETHTCIVRPTEDGQFEVFVSSQGTYRVQNRIAASLKIPENAVDVKVRRLGGGFGGKISRSNLPAQACAIAAYKVRRPVKLVLDMKTNLELSGKRLPYLAKYKVAVNESESKIEAVEMKIYCDCGYTFNESTSGTAAIHAQNCYAADSWRLEPSTVITDKPSNTFCRAPGTTPGHAIIENLMEHVANDLDIDPLEFRLNNMLKQGDIDVTNGAEFTYDENPALVLIKQLRESSNYDARKETIKNSNAQNRWKKRGISLLPTRYCHRYYGARYHVHIVVNAGDGSIAISQGGVEMGQGINTKVAQVVATVLKVPLDIIKVKWSDNLISPNNSPTAGAMGSETCAYAAKMAAQDLKRRMDVIKNQMEDPNPEWKDLVKACHSKAVDLTARHMGHSGNDGFKNYDVWGAVCTEVEVDVLTGETEIRRCDLITDTGMAVSPEIDVGQVEGGLIMGFGLWTTENVVYERETGVNLSNSTWTYKPPTSASIPEDLRTTFFDRKSEGVLGAKCTGEPSVLMSVSVLFAIRQALKSARLDSGLGNKWFPLYGPATLERIRMAGGVSSDNFKL